MKSNTKKNVKNIITVLVCILCLLFSMSGCGSEMSGKIQYSISDDHAEVTGMRGKITDVIIDSEYDGYPVTIICPQAFTKTDIESVSIPSSVEEIGYGAFMNCTHLADVSLPESLYALTDSIFEGCTSLKEIIVPSSVNMVSDDAFLNCTSLENVTFKVKEDADEHSFLSICQAFDGCDSLKSVELPEYAAFNSTPPESICFVLNSTLALSWTPDMNYVFSDSVSFSKVKLWDAIFNGELDYIPVANGIDSFTIEVYNNSDSIMEVDCSDEPPVGIYLYNKSGACQNMLITNIDVDDSYIMDPGDVIYVTADTACMNLHRDIPSSNEKYSLKLLDSKSPLIKLAELFAAGDYSYDVRQAAVWIITDKASFSDTQILSNSITMQSLIDKDEYNTALSLVKKASGKA